METPSQVKRRNQFVFGALISYVTIAFNILSGLLYIPWIIRTIGDEQYALYTLALSVINLFLIDFGIGAAVSKFLTAYYAENRLEDAARFMGIVYKVFFLIAAGIALCLTVLFFFIENIYVKLSADEIFVFKRLFIIVSVYSVVSFPFTTFNSVLMANERFIDVKLCNLLSKVFSVALIILCLLCNMGVYSLVLVNAFVNCVMIGVKYFLIRRNTRQKTDFRSQDRAIAKNLFSFTIWVTVKEIAHRFIFIIMPTIIAAMIGSVEITLFSLASTLEGYVFTFADAVNGMFMPRISKMIRDDNATEQLENLMTRVAKFHVFTIGLIFIGFVCVGKSFVQLWLGNGYDAVYISAIILIFPSLIDTPQQVARTTLMAKDIIKQQALVYAIMAITNVVLAIILLKYIGIVGASVAVCVAYMVRTVCMNILYKKHLHIHLKRYFVTVYGRWILVAVLTLLVKYIVSHWIILPDVWALVVFGLLVIVVYSVLYVLLCVGVRNLKTMILSRRG